MYMAKANEMNAFFRSDEGKFKDKQNFVRNLGMLLAQTWEGVTGAWIDLNDQVHVQFKDDGENVINVEGDSYLAIIVDVAKQIS